MKIQLTGLETGLFAYYKFDESSGQSIYNAISANPLINPIIAVRGLTSQVETSDPVWGKEELAF